MSDDKPKGFINVAELERTLNRHVVISDVPAKCVECLCDKYGDKLGCGDGWTVCRGFGNTPNTEDREILVSIIDRAVARGYSNND